LSDHQLKVVFLGGLGEVGRNLLVLEYGDDLIVVDAGVGFPEEDMFGVELLLPDISYLRERADQVRAIFVTHGHEDHIGALPYLLESLRAPIYSTRLTQGLIRARLRERRVLEGADLRLITPEDRPRFTAGCFTVECFRVAHSIPDAIGFAVRCPAGLVVITGDFKLEPNPVDGRPTDVERIRLLGDEQPLLLISDCVHIETPGSTPPESLVEQAFDEVFDRSPGRILIATFASSISRVQQALDVAYLHGRKVACVGRSLQQNVKVALDLGYLKPPPDTLIRAADAATLRPEEVAYVCTGSQGEPMAVLSRIAAGIHGDITIEPGDTVIVSATPIPGNETSVFRVVNQLFEQGAEVVYGSHAVVHVSGHAGQADLQTMLDLVRPRYVMPTHGEARHLHLYARLAREAGMADDHILLGRNGTLFAVSESGAHIVGEVQAGTVFVGAGMTGHLPDGAIRERRVLARDGVLSVVVTIDRSTGALLSDPLIAGRGFVPGPKNGHLLEEAREYLREALGALPPSAESGPHAVQVLGEALQAFVYEQTRRRPLVLPTVVHV
jgi:ribonuclease J